jgi:hypothetical protein
VRAAFLFVGESRRSDGTLRLRIARSPMISTQNLTLWAASVADRIAYGLRTILLQGIACLSGSCYLRRAVKGGSLCPLFDLNPQVSTCSPRVPGLLRSLFFPENKCWSLTLRDPTGRSTSPNGSKFVTPCTLSLQLSRDAYHENLRLTERKKFGLGRSKRPEACNPKRTGGRHKHQDSEPRQQVTGAS